MEIVKIDETTWRIAVISKFPKFFTANVFNYMVRAYIAKVLT